MSEVKYSPEMIRRLLEYDGLAEAENLTGVDYKSSKLTLVLGMSNVLVNSSIRTNAMMETNDTTFGDTVDRYISVIHDIGFIGVFAESFLPTEKFPDMKEKEYLYVFWHPEDGILMHFDTFRGNVNSGAFHYNWECDQSPEKRVTSSGTWDRNDGRPPYLDDDVSRNFPRGYTWSGDHECREAVRFHIQELKRAGRFVNPWRFVPYFSLTHFMDWWTNPRTFPNQQQINAIKESRISKLPEYVQQAIKGSVIKIKG